MFRYSRNARKYFRGRTRKKGLFHRFFTMLFVLFVLYEIITLFFLSSYTVRTAAMEPLIQKNGKILAVPFILGVKIPFSHFSIPGIRNPRRGDIVIITAPNRTHYSWYAVMGDAIIRFFTFQKKTILPRTGMNAANKISIKRIIGIPGDTVKMENFTVYIKPYGSTQYVKAKTLIPEKFKRKKTHLPEGWKKDEPYSGYYSPITVSSNHYYVLNDNRNDRNDSRFFGTIQQKAIKALVVLNYSPHISLLQ